MKILVTGSSGHLGEALVRTLNATAHEAIGLDLQPSAFTQFVGSIADRPFIEQCMSGVDAVIHTATLHKPHVATHTRQAFVDTNITGTLNLLEAATTAGVQAFVFTSTTSAFGDALTPPADQPAAWLTEAVSPVPKNIYGATKTAAEDLCQLFHRNAQLPCVILRTSRFFPEADDNPRVRQHYADANLKTNEFLYRRVDIADVVSAHVCALERAPQLGFGRYIITATTPFGPEACAELRTDAPGVLKRLVPAYAAEYERRGWRMFPSIDRVYVNELARCELGWQPRYNFDYQLACLQADLDPRSALACSIGSKGYHAQQFAQGPYPTEAEATLSL